MRILNCLRKTKKCCLVIYKQYKVPRWKIINIEEREIRLPKVGLTHANQKDARDKEVEIEILEINF